MLYDNINWHMDRGYWHNNIHGLLHRYIYEQYNGPIPKGYIVHHDNGIKTDNAPKNLIMMTRGEHNKLHHKGKLHTEEAKDKMSKATKGLHQGEKHPRAKLTNLDIKWIRVWLSLGYTQLSIAKAFNVGQGCISHIKTGRTRLTAC